VKACETLGRCASCGADRLVPGIGTTGPLCADCAGLGDYFTCHRCGEEGWQHGTRGCGSCVLGDRLATVLDDGTGKVRGELVPFYDAVRRMRRPRSGLLWLNKPHVPPILRALARSEVPLTHEGLNQLSPWRSVTYVRDHLVDSGVLPPADRFLLMFENRLPGWLTAIPDLEHRKILHRFATWNVLRRLRATATEACTTTVRSS
jgi:hypothetical protein